MRKISPLYIKPKRSSLAVLDRTRLLVCYFLTVSSLVAAVINTIYDLKSKNYFEALTLILFVVFLLITLILFLQSNQLKIFQMGLSISIFLLMTINIVLTGGYYGLGLLYFLTSLFIISFITTFKIGLFMPVYYFLLTFLRLSYFPIHEESIFYSGVIRERFILFMSFVCIMSLIIHYSLHIFIRYMRRIAFTDTLTGVSNRTQLNEFIISASKSRSGFSLIGIKIINLQKINSNLGSVSGDEYVKAIINRLNRYTKSNEILGRWSGSLIVILSEGTDEGVLKERAEILNQTITNSYDIERGKVSGQFITGISIFPKDTENPLQLVENVNFLLDNPNVLPGDIIFFEKMRLIDELEKFRVIEELNQADFDRDFSIKFQPKINLNSRVCVGAEVLLRWESPDLGIIPPDKFIPLAEECGIIKSLTRWVINRSFKEIKSIQDIGIDKDEKLNFAINLSILDLKDSDFIDYILEKKQEYLIDSSIIEFEVTEGLLIDEDPILTGNLIKLNDNGFSLAIDDFGTGYSSLSYLHKIHIHNLKLDKSFISSIQSDENSPVIDAIISMGISLGLDITAEGVEELYQERYLRDRGCNIAQGWLYSRALKLRDFINYLNSYI